MTVVVHLSVCRQIITAYNCTLCLLSVVVTTGRQAVPGLWRHYWHTTTGFHQRSPSTGLPAHSTTHTHWHCPPFLIDWAWSYVSTNTV